MTSVIASLIVALSLADAAGTEPPARRAIAIDVPYLPQTEALCGGAVAAMVFRYWGERHADDQQFAPLVDRRSGGIATGALTEAIRRRGWEAIAVSGTLEGLRQHLERDQPIILLIEDRPGRYHYVVAVGADDAGVFIHDPVWGPSRYFSESELVGAWKPTNFWSLLVRPTASAGASTDEAASNHSALPIIETAAAGRTKTTCDVLLERAIDDIKERGLHAADELLGAVRTQCQGSAAPISELAGVRFAQQRWEEAATLAQEALRHDETDTYAWDLLASSRFLTDDLPGALEAWNQTGKPHLDALRIEGLTRTRYAFVAEVLGLKPNALLTKKRYRLAERRLRELPDRSTSRINYRPRPDGFATVDVAILEPSARPSWIATGARAIVNREIAVHVPGWTGLGDVWNVSWRWWNERPGVGLSFEAPRVAPIPGVWRVEGSWVRQAYAGPPDRLRQGFVEPTEASAEADAPPTRETWTHVGLATTSWIAPDIRYEVAAGFDVWNGSRRAASVRGILERRFLADRISVMASASAWTPVSAGARFHAASFRASARSATEPRRFVHRADLQLERVTRHAPLALWSGAGDGHARPLLLRAHPLIHDGIIDGPVFGRRVASLSIETERWFDRPSLVRMGIAAFADAATASQRLESAMGKPLQVDVGAGLRLRLPGHEGTLRVDYGHGLRDGHDALTLGWQLTEQRRILP